MGLTGVLAQTASYAQASNPSLPTANAQHSIADFKPVAQQSTVDLVLALDVSSSMSGLINSAKQRLWDVVNNLGQAQPSPKLRVAIITFGNPSYGAASGYVRVDQPFTSDLDKVNQTLFSFSTNGGDEYVARAVHTAMETLQWSAAPNAGRILFVAGNEGAAQDPQYTLIDVAQRAKEMNLVVNAIFCGGPDHTDAASWAQVAQLANGMYAAIDQNAAALAQISTPMDTELAKLNSELNSTYIAYGSRGKSAKDNQREQDANTASMSESALVARAVTKASKLYRSEDWDLVDAKAAGMPISTIDKTTLPAELKELSDAQLAVAVEQKAEQRRIIKAKVQDLSRQRDDYIKQNKPKNGASGLDDAMQQGLEKLAKQQGLILK